MYFKFICIQLLVLVMLVNADAQSGVDAVLASIEKNNKNLSANRQLWEAKKLDFKTGLTLPNPTLQGQYLFGSPATAGNQTDFFAVQSFDFPTTYKKRRQLADMQASVSTPHLAAQRQEILLEGQKTCLEMIWRNKLKVLYQRRFADLEKLLRDFQKKLETGEGNILDVNKTRLQLLEIKQLQAENDAGLLRLQTHLTELNGGEPLVFTDTIYPLLSVPAGFEAIEKAYEAADPHRQILEQQKRIAEKQLDVSKTWKLPAFEAGYHYQGILGQQFNGLHAGVTLPLWEQKYRKQAAQAQVSYTELQLQAHLNEHFYKIREMFDRQAGLEKSLQEYRSGLAPLSNTALLDKALRLGEISTIEYFLETSFYQNALIHLLKTEYEYYAAVADLMRYRL